MILRRMLREAVNHNLFFDFLLRTEKYGKCVMLKFLYTSEKNNCNLTKKVRLQFLLSGKNNSAYMLPTMKIAEMTPTTIPISMESTTPTMGIKERIFAVLSCFNAFWYIASSSGGRSENDTFLRPDVFTHTTIENIRPMPNIRTVATIPKACAELAFDAKSLTAA